MWEKRDMQVRSISFFPHNVFLLCKVNHASDYEFVSACIFKLDNSKTLLSGKKTRVYI